MISKTQINTINSFKKIVSSYQSLEFHESCILKMIAINGYKSDIFIEPNNIENLEFLSCFKDKIYSYILNIISKYNTNELLKQVMLFQDCVRFEEFEITTDIENTLLHLKTFVCATLPSRKNKKITVDEFKEVIQFAYIYSNLEINISIYNYIDFKHTLFDYCNNILTQDSFDEYFNNYYLMGDIEKPEDVGLISEGTKYLLETKGLLPNQIRMDIVNNLNLGFNFEDILKFEKAIEDNFNPLVIYIKNIKDIEKCFEISGLEKICRFFSFKNGDSYNYLNIQLRPIYYNQNTIYLTKQETLNAITIFKNLILSEHFISYYNLDQYKKIFQSTQNSITKFFSYKIADILDQHKFLIPRSLDNTLMVDIIINNLKLNIDINDIDVLALDPKDKILYNIELKYYKPAIEFADLYKDTFSSKHIEKVLNRESQIKEIKNYILSNYFNIKSSFNDYEVKSIMIISRIKYKAIYGNNKIEIMTYGELIKKLYK